MKFAARYVSLVLAAAWGLSVQAQAPENLGGNGRPYSKCWEYHFENTVRKAIVSANGTVYLSEAQGRVRAITGSDSKVIWTAEIGGEILDSLPISERGLLVVSTSGPPSKRAAILRLLDLETGLVRYAKPLDIRDDQVFTAFSGNRLVVAAKHGSLNVFNIADGGLLWSRDLGEVLSASVVVSESHLAVATATRIVTFEFATGSVVSNSARPYITTALAIDRSGTVFAGDERGNVARMALNEPSGWRYKSGARVAHILLTPSGLMIASHDNFLYLISDSNGDVVWKRRLDGRLTDSPLVSGEVVIAPIYGEETAAVIDISNGRAIDRLQLGENRYSLTSPVETRDGMLVLSVPGAIISFTRNGCVEK